MRRCRMLLLAALLLGGCSKVPTAPSTSNPVPPPNGPNGLQGAEQSRWRHLAEGSEIYPLAWLRALEDPETNRPFLDNPQRFGLLADADVGPDNPFGLPIGLTVDESRDLRFLGVQMVGVNCAACHVAELHKGGQAVTRIDGAPNLFDLEKFYGDLARATAATFTDVRRTWRFVTKLYGVSRPGSPGEFAASAPPGAAPVLEGAPDLDALRRGAALEQALAERVEAVHKEEAARPTLDLEAGLVTRPAGPPDGRPNAAAEATSQRRRALGVKDRTEAARDLAAKAPAANSPLARMDAPARQAALGNALTHFAETVGLLKARAAFLLRLVARDNLAHTAPGFGRVDAFGGARNRVFANDPKPMTAPISYPHLWGLNQIVWFHWDGNTTSLLERNVGQAIGLGALYNPATSDSTVIVANLVQLEDLARKIRPPSWPDAFDPVNQARFERGKALFAARCQECHAPVADGGKVADVLDPLPDIGTDPLRAENFAQPANGRPFNEALSDVLKAVTRKAGGQVTSDNEWRVTRQYARRPLRAIWATAPYLHNNSVPTLHDLLLPADQRPKKFRVGGRDYDPVNLGYKSDAAGGPSFEFDVAQPGNSNAGHSGPRFGTDLTKEERLDLLEYLKGT
jgi:mono/diheme cytochrome c family protein